MVQKDWIVEIPSALEFLDPPWHGVVEGLLSPRPQYRIPEQENPLEDYRDFRHQGDIQSTGEALDMIAYQGRLLVDHLGLHADIMEDIRRVYASWNHTHRLTWSVIFLTVLSGHLLGHPYVLVPLSPDHLQKLLQMIRPPGSSSGLDPAIKERIFHDMQTTIRPPTERESSATFSAKSSIPRWRGVMSAFR